MNQMEGHKELVKKLSALVTSLENGALTLEQLNELEEVTRKLHERSVILRYKAYEQQVLDTEKVEDGIEETVPEEPTVVPEEVESEEEEEAFDFAIFDEGESNEEEVEEAPLMTFGEPEAEMPAEEVESVPEAETTQDEIEEESEPEAIIEDKKEAAVDTPVTSSDTGASFLDKFAQQDNSVAGRFSARPLDSLIGAFGLNERLRFINDLFDGSSEQFSDAIKALDSQSGLNAAREKAASYAVENDWDPEEEVVAEFMNYLNRRYA